jgi:hypothetical protein
MMLTLGFAFSGCDTPTGGGDPYDGSKTIKITGLQDGITAQWIYIFSEEKGIPSWPPTARATIEEYDGQTITIPLVTHETYRSDNPEPWTGTGKFYIEIECYPPRDNPTRKGSKYVYSVDGTNPSIVDIQNEVTSLEWSKFIWRSDYIGG